MTQLYFGIRFDDNDFSSSVRAFVELFFRRRQPDELTRAEIKAAFEKYMPALAGLVQGATDVREGYFSIQEENIFLTWDEFKASFDTYGTGGYEYTLIDVYGEIQQW